MEREKSSGYFRVVFRENDGGLWQVLTVTNDPREAYIQLRKARAKFGKERSAAVNPQGWRMIIGRRGRGASTRYVVVHDYDVFPTSAQGPIAPSVK